MFYENLRSKKFLKILEKIISKKIIKELRLIGV